MGYQMQYGESYYLALPQPAAPTLAVVGTPGSTPVNYYVVAHCGNLESIPSAAASINPPNTLSGSAYVSILPPSQTGTGIFDLQWSSCTWDVLKGTTATSIITNSLLPVFSGNVIPFQDTGQSTSGYTALGAPTIPLASIPNGMQYTGGNPGTKDAGGGFLVKSADGSHCAKLGIDDSGALLVTSVACW
jgi:hypothetical protein